MKFFTEADCDVFRYIGPDESGGIMQKGISVKKANQLINDRCYTYECDRSGKMLKVIEEIEEDSAEKILKDILHYNRDNIGPVFVQRAEKLLKGETK
jgi:hypothetical protein